MRVVCTCGVVLVDEPAPEGLVSHGLCERCYLATYEALLRSLDHEGLRAEHRTVLADYVSATKALVSVAPDRLGDALDQCLVASRDFRAVTREIGRRSKCAE